MDEQASGLNKTITNENAKVFEMLSEKGKNIFFPKLGILAQSAQAKGKNINATIGEAVEDDGYSMHFPEFDNLIRIPGSSIFPYAPSFGKKDLRDKWKEFILEKNPSLHGTLISTPVATCGITHGISMACYMFVDPNDSVILPNLFWENYNLIIENGFGGKVQLFELFKGESFNIDSFAKKINEEKNDKVVVLLNFPNNPSGYTPLISEVDSIINELFNLAARGKNVVVLIDDAYFGLVFEDKVYKESIFSKIANLHENILAVKLDGATKEDFAWGLRVGFITYGVKNGTLELYEALENKTAGAIRGNISNISHLSQSLLQKIYNREDYLLEKQNKYEILKKRYIILKNLLKNPVYAEYFEPLPFNSGYFMCLKLKKGLNTEEVRVHLLTKYNTGVIALGDVIRLAFSSVSHLKIPELLDNLYNTCKELTR
jgi:aspartate/methionine/tyrosine aminotransferase